MAELTTDVPTAPRSEPASEPVSRDFQVVPLRGLPVVGLVLAGLVTTIATNRLWAIDFYHVVGGGMWTALDLFLGFVIGPILGRLSIPARTELTTRLMPKMVLIMPTLVVCTLAAGWQLARHLWYLDTSYSHRGWVVASFVVVAVMAVVALGLLEPANIAVLFELKKPVPDGEVIGRLNRSSGHSRRRGPPPPGTDLRGTPNGIRTRVTALKGRCVGSAELLESAKAQVKTYLY